MYWELAAGLENTKQQLQHAVDHQRLGHALLFTGKDGYGVLPLVLDLVQYIFSKESDNGADKVSSLNHVDLHFTFPMYTLAASEKVEDNTFYGLFRSMVLENPYASLEDWIRRLDSEKKQLFISAKEIDTKCQKFTLKSYEGGSKILILWHAEKMNESASNKLLKFLEEPPKNTYIFLTTENADDLLPTVQSRVQKIEVHRPASETIATYLKKVTGEEIPPDHPAIQRAQGDINTALKIIKNDTDQDFEFYFIEWVRSAARVVKKPELLKDIILWSRTLGGWTREKQKQFIEYCAEMFRLALLQNYGADTLVYQKLELNGFKWESFAAYVSGANIELILKELSDAEYQLQRNGNAKIIFADMGIKLSRYLTK